jgi:hypothetical protein
MSIYKWSEINIHYFVLQYSMKDDWFLWPLFCNRVWYDSPVFDLSTIIDKLELHMVQSKCIVGLDSFLCLSKIFVCVMKLWNILGHSSTPKMEHLVQKGKVSSNATVSQIMTTITPNSWGGKQIVPKASFEFHTIGNLMHYHLHPYPLLGPLPIFVTSQMVY